jgi:hypothetical protein
MRPMYEMLCSLNVMSITYQTCYHLLAVVNAVNRED